MLSWSQKGQLHPEVLYSEGQQNTQGHKHQDQDQQRVTKH